MMWRHAQTGDKKFFIHDNFVIIGLQDRFRPGLLGFTLSKIPFSTISLIFPQVMVDALK
jgi:hypothetical protein